MKWTKFSSGEYPKNDAAFVSDGKGVWVTTRSYFQAALDMEDWKEYANFHDVSAVFWAEISLPEVPKRELHRCDSVDDCSFCEETETGLKLTAFHNCEKIRMNLKFCPFCGYHIEEKK